MGTDIRPELSKKNRYWIEKHRYYELKHFCLQYPIWKKAYLALTDLKSRPADMDSFAKSNNLSDPTWKIAEARLYYESRIKMIEDTAKRTDDVIGDYILKAVTQGYSYDTLNVRFGMPCCKEVYYKLYRKFFLLLSHERD